MDTTRTRILVDDERLARMRRRIESDEGFRGSFAKLRAEADRFATEALSLDASKDGKVVEKHFTRPFDRMLTTLSFVFMIEGKEKHADAARRVLDIVARAQEWEGRWKDRVPNWRASLSASQTSIAFARAMSWLGDSLGAADREQYAKALYDKGIRLLMEDWIWAGSRLHALDSMGHNFWACAVAGAGFAAIAALDLLPQAREWIEEVNSSLLEWYEYPGNILQNKVPNFGHDGGYYESQSYALIIEYVLLFADAYRSVAGDSPLEKAPQLKGMPEYFLRGAYESSEGLLSVNFGDHVSTDWIGEHGDYLHTVLLRLAAVLKSGHARWLADRARPYPREPMGFVWFDDSVPARRPGSLAPSRLFQGIGWAVLRDRWGVDKTLFAMKAGTTWNHAHADAGSFVLWAHGQQLIVDSGTVNYPRKEYVPYFCQALAHNVVMVDGRSEPVRDIYRGSRQAGRIPVLIATPSYQYLYADATGPNCAIYERYYRHVVWIDGSFIIIDDLLSHAPGVFEWLFHPGGEVILPDRAPDGTPRVIEIRKEKARLRMCVVHPETVECEARTGYAELDRANSKEVAPAEAVYYALKARALHKARAAGETAFGTSNIEADLDETGREQKFIVVLTPYKARQKGSLPLVHPIEGQNLRGVRLVRPDRTVEIVFNLLADGRMMHHNSINSYGSISTDASIIVVCRNSSGANELPGSACGYRMHNGSFLRVDGQPVIESPLKGDFVLDAEAGRRACRIVSHKGFAVSLGCPAEPKAINVKPSRSRPQAIRYDAVKRLLHMRMAVDDTDLQLELT